MKKIQLLLALVCFVGMQSYAQENSTEAPVKKNKWSYSSGVEGSILQFARVSTGGSLYKMINPRFSYFFNTGFDANYKLHNNFQLFTGFQVKNLGLIIKTSDSTRTKHRVYTVGAPLGIKINSSNKKFMFKTGVDVALAFNYKRKFFKNDDKIYKDNEFLSNNTNLLFSSVFVGFVYSGLSVSGNFYLNDFFNQGKVGLTGINARLITISAGLSLNENSMKKKTK